MRLVLTGGAGFLGQAVLRELARGGGRWPLDSLSITSVDLRQFTPEPAVRDAGLDLVQIQADVCDAGALRRAFAGADAVVHAATVVAWSDAQADLLQRVNVDGTRAVVQACAAAGVPVLVHTSTMDVVCGDGPVEQADETWPYPRRFLDAYGRTKAESEQVVRAAAPPLSWAILRCAAMWGEADPYKLPNLLREARAGRLLCRVGDGSAHMQPLYVGNAAVAVLRALEHLQDGTDQVHGETFFLTDHASGNFFDWMAPVLHGLGHDIPERRLPRSVALGLGALSEAAAWCLRPLTRITPPMTRSSVRALTEHSIIDGTKARLRLGYAPQYTYDDAVARTVAWFRSHDAAAT